MEPLDAGKLPEVTTLPVLPDEAYPVKTLVLYDGTVYRACLDEWTRVPSAGYEIIATDPDWEYPQRWPGYEAVEGKHGVLREAEQLAQRFKAKIVIEDLG